jgi:RsiW-degrading membrane proteinase PrsW (M82 family)
MRLWPAESLAPLPAAKLEGLIQVKIANMSRNNVLYLIVGALVVVVAVLGYQLYQKNNEPKGLNINVGPGGLSIKSK